MYGKREGITITTVIAQKTDNGVNLAWDSLVSPVQTSYPKVVEVNEQFHLGGAGRLRYLNILQMAEVPKVHDAEFAAGGFEPLQYLISEVIPAWIDALDDALKKVPDEKDDWPFGVGLVVIKGRIFEVGGDFAVSEALGNFGIGSGADYALGALAAGKSVEKALEIAAELDRGTGGELHVMKGLK